MPTRNEKITASRALRDAARGSLAMVEALIAATPSSDDPNALNGLHQWAANLRGALDVAARAGL